METIKYNIGETPAEVIREQIDAALDELADSGEYIAGHAYINRDTDRDELLTVLDALALAQQWHHDEEAPGANPMEAAAAELLRVDILAALGIDESNDL